MDEKIPLTVKLDDAAGKVLYLAVRGIFSSNYFKIEQACSRRTH